MPTHAIPENQTMNSMGQNVKRSFKKILKTPEKINNAQIITHVMIGAILILEGANSIVNQTSPAAIWLIINLFQMLMLLMLNGAFIPKTVRQYLSTMDYVLLNLEFISIKDAPLISDLYTWMKFEQKNENLQDVGVGNGSTAINNISFFIIILILIVIHIPIIIIKC